MVKVVENGFIIAISKTADDGIEIAQEEYSAILSAINNKPEQKDGFATMLTDNDLEWKYVAITEPVNEEAGPEDYEQALEQMGVDFNDEN